MDITIEYTEEEQRIFYEAHALKEQVAELEREEYVLRREKQEHTKEYNADYRTPMIASIIATVMQIILLAEILKGGIYIAIVTQVLTITIITTGVAIYYWRRYYLQNTKNPVLWEKAKKRGIVNYYAIEWKLDQDYKLVRQQLAELTPKWQAKEAEKEAIEEAKYTAPTIVTAKDQTAEKDVLSYFWQEDKAKQ